MPTTGEAEMNRTTAPDAAPHRRDPLRAAAPRAECHVLTAAEFDVLWERLGLGPTPVVLRLDSPGRTRTERREIEAAGWQALRRRGLAGPTGAHPELTRLLHLLARPRVTLELRGWWGRSVRAVAAGAPEAGVLAVRQDGSVTLQACGSLPSALLRVLPPAAPGTGRATTLPTAVLAAALGAAPGGPAPGPARGTSPLAAVGALRAALVDRGVGAGDAGLLARMLGSTERRAQLVALTGDRWGGTTRAGGVLGVLDGPRGRYLLTRSPADDGVEWTTVAPVDDRRLRHRLGELLAGAVPRDAHPGDALLA
jgi:ESX secretion-associated protein EspG